MAIVLPNEGVMPGIFKGRVPLEGYQRGRGLQYGALLEAVESDPLFKDAARAAEKFVSYVSRQKRANIFLLLTNFLGKLPDRNIIEFGAYKGGNSVFMATVLKECAPEAKVYALDTYEGMPVTDKGIDAHNKGDFDDASSFELRDHAEAIGLTNLVIVKGLFQETFPKLDPNLRFGLAHLDADIYSAIKYAQDAVWPFMTKGGYLVYDDADVSSCIGATQAVEELIQERRVHSEQIWPHFVFRVGLEDSQKK